LTEGVPTSGILIEPGDRVAVDQIAQDVYAVRFGSLHKIQPESQQSLVMEWNVDIRQSYPGM